MVDFFKGRLCWGRMSPGAYIILEICTSKIKVIPHEVYIYKTKTMQNLLVSIHSIVSYSLVLAPVFAQDILVIHVVTCSDSPSIVWRVSPLDSKQQWKNPRLWSTLTEPWRWLHRALLRPTARTRAAWNGPVSNIPCWSSRCAGRPMGFGQSQESLSLNQWSSSSMPSLTWRRCCHFCCNLYFLGSLFSE